MILLIIICTLIFSILLVTYNNNKKEKEKKRKEIIGLNDICARCEVQNQCMSCAHRPLNINRL